MEVLEMDDLGTSSTRGGGEFKRSESRFSVRGDGAFDLDLNDAALAAAAEERASRDSKEESERSKESERDDKEDKGGGENQGPRAASQDSAKDIA